MTETRVVCVEVPTAYPALSDAAPLRLASAVGIGAVTYFVVLATTWVVAGKPRGAEKLLWQRR